MIKKTEACGIDAMRFASALAVIRYNDGFAGIKRLYEALGLELTDTMKNFFTRLDKDRVENSFNIIPLQRMRFIKKQRSGLKVTRQVKKYGKGYSSGSYTAARQLFMEENSETEEEIDDNINLLPTSSTDIPNSIEETPEELPCVSTPVSDLETYSRVDRCEFCGGTDADRLVGFGLRAKMIG